MSCNKYERLIVDYLANELKGAEAGMLEEHLKTCKICGEILEEYRNVMAKTKELQVPVYGEEFWTARLNEIKNCRTRSKTRAFLKPVILSASALLFFAVISAALFHRTDTGTAKSRVIKNNYAMALNELPYPEDTLMDMVDYIDDDSASELLNIIFENNLISAHIE